MERIRADHGSSKLLRILSATMGKEKTVRDRPANDFHADEFANYFSQKVSVIRAATRHDVICNNFNDSCRAVGKGGCAACYYCAYSVYCIQSGSRPNLRLSLEGVNTYHQPLTIGLLSTATTSWYNTAKRQTIHQTRPKRWFNLSLPVDLTTVTHYPRRARSALGVDTVLTLDVCMFVCMLGL